APRCASSLAASACLSGALRSQIVGGHEAKPHSRPYMPALKVSGGFNCGGVSVSIPGLASHNPRMWVFQHQRVMVRVCLVLELNLKPGLTPISTPRQIPDDKYVQVIPLPKSSSDIPPDTKCIVSGWGLIDKEVATAKLFETNIAVLSRRKCLQFYPELSSGMVCGAWVLLNPISPCLSQGDSGGPLVCNGVVQGIVSDGFQFPPSVYTRIAHYLPWIRKTMGQ
uniref:Peptidase S1 domain-containing protein n=1 Tax=Chelydra serpentina TaxID=8475 RepID=A0A8C3T166_CHESE